MTTTRAEYKRWADSVHADLEAHYGYGLGDFEDEIDLGDYFEQYASAEEILIAIGVCLECMIRHDESGEEFCMACRSEHWKDD